MTAKTTKPKAVKKPATKTKAPPAAKAKAVKSVAAPATPAYQILLERPGTRIHYVDATGETAIAAMIPVADAAQALGRILIRSITMSDDTVLLGTMLDRHSNTPDQPGIVLSVSADGILSLDDDVIGPVTGNLINDAAFATLIAVQGVDDEPRTPIGWHVDWQARATDALASVRLGRRQMAILTEAAS